MWRDGEQGETREQLCRARSNLRVLLCATRSCAQRAIAQTPLAMPPVFCSAPDLTLEELEAELGLIGSAKQILAAIAVQARLRGLVAKRRAREATSPHPYELLIVCPKRLR